MSPYTLHYMATLIRHNRGIATATEKWIQSPGFSKEEALAAVAFGRKILDAYERSIGSSVLREDQSVSLGSK